jgi:hypothetical protein
MAISLETYALLKAYVDEHGGGGEEPKDKVSPKTLAAAKEYADGKDAETLTTAEQYADTKDTAALQSAKDYADTKDATVLSSAKDYADTKDTATLNSAKSYADGKATATLASANTYAHNQADAALYSAKDYAEECADNALDEAKEYTDNATLNSYIVTDGTPGTITIGTGWSSTEPFSIVVTSQDYTVTEHTMVSILPHTGTLIQMREDGVQTMYITNDEGTLTVYAIGHAPTVAMTVPVLYTEVE